MKLSKLLIPFFLLIIFNSLQAQRLQDNFKGSIYTYVYRLDSVSAAEIYSNRVLLDSSKYFVNPVDSFRFDREYNYDSLKPGHYLFLRGDENNVRYWVHEKPVFTLRSQGVNRQFLIYVYDLKGNVIRDARLKLIKGGKMIVYEEDCACYPIPLPRRKPLLPVDFLVLRGSEFTFGSYSCNNSDIAVQKRGKKQAGSTAANSNGTIIMPGYLVFNQPKFKLLDTLKWKAFLMKPNGKPYRKQVKVYTYNDSQFRLLKQQTLKPVSRGAYTGEIAIADTFVLDNKYAVRIYSKRNILLKSESFSVENYDLKKSFFDARINKNYFYSGEDIRFTVSAFDANKLPLLDTRVNVVVALSQLQDFFEDSLFVPFSWSEKFWEYSALSDPSGVTVIDFPTKPLPGARLQFVATVTLTNPEGERREFVLNFTWDPTEERYLIVHEGDSIRADFLLNAGSTKKRAIIKAWNTELLWEKEVMLPYRFKVEDFPLRYDLYADNKFQASLHLDDNQAQLIGFEGYRTYDSLVFSMLNPLGIKVNYKIYEEDKYIEGGSGTRLEYRKLKPSGTSFHVIYSFRWKGIEYVKEEGFYTREKELNVAIDQAEMIYPGQRVPVSIHVTDYKGKDANRVNLTAYSVNAQLGAIPEPVMPYFGKKNEGILKTFYLFNTRAGIVNVKPMNGFYARMPLMATSPYYKLIFSPSGYAAVYEDIGPGKSEISPYVMKDMVSLPIQAIYLNDAAVYVAGVNVKNPYSFLAEPGIYTVKLRTQNRMISVKNVELKKGKKLFMAVRDDSLTSIPNVSYVTMQAPYVKEEQASLAKHLLYFNSSFVKNTGQYFLVQGNRIFCPTIFMHYNTVYEAGNYYVAGPFQRGAIQLVFPGKDSLEFYFEPGSAYSFYDDSVSSRDLPQLKGKLPSMLNVPATATGMVVNERAYPWPYVFGKHETVPPPVIPEKVTRNHPALHDYSRTMPDSIYANFFLKNNTTRSIKRVWFFNRAEELNSRIFFSAVFDIQNLKPGNYDIFIQDIHDSVCVFMNFPIKAEGTTYKFISKGDFRPYDSLLVSNLEDRVVALNRPAPRLFDNPPVPITEVKRVIKEEAGKTSLSGYLMDQNGRPIDMVTIFLENDGIFVAGAITNQLGYFRMEAGENYTVQLKIFVLGKYYTLYPLFLPRGRMTELQINLPNTLGQSYDWVNVQALGANTVYQTSYTNNTYAAPINESLSYSDVVQVRGSRSMPLSYKLQNVAAKAMESLAVAEADRQSPEQTLESKKNKFSDFFDRIKGDSSANRIRSKFRDYGYFIPNLLTDRKGEAHFTVVFPDNQTLWKTIVPAVDYHKRTGLGLAEVKAFKPLNATLAMPKFFVEHDTLKIIGKVFNYTDKAIPITTFFKIDNAVMMSSARAVKSFLTDSMMLHLPAPGKYDIVYSFETGDKYMDGEQRSLPVFVDGTEIVEGINFMAEGDTSLVISPDPTRTKTTITLTNKQLDLIIAQIDKLKNYTYGCNEQNASKLKALLAEKAVFPALGREFRDDKLIVKQIRSLEKTQRKDGAWGWWNVNDQTEPWMTVYITEALNMAVKAGFHTRAHIRGAEYLRANLSHFEVTDRLYAIALMSEFYGKPDYLAQIKDFDRRNLSLQDEFRLMRLRQIMGLPIELKSLFASMETSGSGCFWGEEVLDFKTNIIPTTALAYSVLKNDSLDHSALIFKIRRYLMTHPGMARNTIEQAVLLQTTVGDILAENRLSQEIKPELTLNGQRYFVETFPHTIKAGNEEAMMISKKGAPLFFSIHHYSVARNPVAVDTLYRINAWMEQDGKTTNVFRKSVPIQYHVEIKAARDGEFVMIEIPIPSSCFYDSKVLGQIPYEVNREYFDNKVVIFCRKLPKGDHRLMVSLQPRFEGRSTVLPVKASLMYYPDHCGMNTKMLVSVKE